MPRPTPTPTAMQCPAEAEVAYLNGLGGQMLLAGVAGQRLGDLFAQAGINPALRTDYDWVQCG